MVLLNGIIRASRSSRPLPRYLSTLHTAPCPTIDNKQWNDEHDNRIQLRQYQQPINTIINSSLPSNGIIRRQYHATPSRDRAAAIIMGFGALAAAAKAGQYAAQGYNEWKEERDAAAEELEKWKKENPEAAAEQEAAAQAAEEEASSSSSSSTSSSSSSTGGAEEATASGTGGAAAGGAKQKEGKRENIFASFFNMSVGSKYYEGGFEDTMTRKEAALILGVRESSAAKRIKEAHRKLLVLNHPDTGGSTFMAGKINEAKELLLKGRKM